MTHFVKKLQGFFKKKSNLKRMINDEQELKLHKNKTIRDQYFDEQSRFK